MTLVSVIVPCYNEQGTIQLLLDALYKQNYPRANLEVIIADGLSADLTRSEIAGFQREHPDLLIKIIDNSKRIIPAALNIALEAAQGKYIVRLDAHSMPYPDYISNCIQDLEGGIAENVGGVWEIHPANSSWIARAIAISASHPLGVGDAQYRNADKSQYVDTVPFGAFQRSLVDHIGGYDETLQTNEDYEFNVRVRQSGGRVWLNPAIRSVYFSRPNLGALARQYWRYGYWKGRMLIRYPRTIRWRQGLPPLFVLSLVGLILLGIWLPIGLWIFGAELLIYTLTILVNSSILAIKRHDPTLSLGVPLAIITMHLCWGTALVWSVISSRRTIKRHDFTH